LIILSGLHTEIKERFVGTDCQLLEMKTSALDDSFDDIVQLGRIFNKQQQAAQIVDDIKQDLGLIARKLDSIPQEKRKRVIRLMGRDQVMTPGTDSFQNEMIRAAGGITHDFDKNGNIITVTKEEWIKFNPQVIYGCGGDKKTAETFFTKPGWKDVEAVKNSRIYYYPCDLTCRAATHTGYFVSWLASNIYGEQFSKKDHQEKQDPVFDSRTIDVGLDYVKDARVVYSKIFDFTNKTLVVDLKKPMTIVSTLEGQRRNIKTVGNHFSPAQYWAVAHKGGLEGHRKRVYKVLGQKQKHSSFLFTGADMDNLSVQEASFKELRVKALVTAGVKSNAMRMAKDEGLHYEPGTINVIIMANMKLTPRAMTRAIISATEAKTAALMDMDIRSSYGDGAYRATGTGTDNVMVVEGKGTLLKNAGGHTKLGELIAKAVYAGVQEAVLKQNRLFTARNIFQRLKERDITIFGLIASERCDCGRDRNDFSGAVEELLLQPQYAGFMEAALALSDDYEKGLVKDLTTFNMWCSAIAGQIAGRQIPEMKEIAKTKNVPPVIGAAINALLNGVYYQPDQE